MTRYCLDHFNQIQPGDIIIFRPSSNGSRFQKFLASLQQLTPQTYGDAFSTHTAICIDVGSEGPVIAHITRGKGTDQFEQEPLLRLMERDGGDRPCLVFRPNDARMKGMITQSAQQGNDSLKWTINGALKTPATLMQPAPSIHTPSSQPFMEQSVCSIFVLEVLVKAACDGYEHAVSTEDEQLEYQFYPAQKSTARRYLPSIAVTSPVNVLENDLYLRCNESENQLASYTLFHYPEQNPFSHIMQLIETELERIKRQAQFFHSEIVQKKHDDVLAALNELREPLTYNNSLNQFEKTIVLLERVLPLLAMPTSPLRIFQMPTSYNNVVAEAQRLGFYSRYLRDVENSFAQRIVAASEVGDRQLRNLFKW